MATFSIVSQALRTGEPLPEAFHQNLLDRLHYHSRAAAFAQPSDGQPYETQKAHLESITQYEYIFYACAIAAVFQIIQVSLFLAVYGYVQGLAKTSCVGSQRVQGYYDKVVRRGSYAWLGPVEGGVR